MKKEMKKMLTTLEESGAVIKLTKKNHISVRLPNNKIVILSGTPSDHRAFKNMQRDIKRSMPGIIK